MVEPQSSKLITRVRFPSSPLPMPRFTRTGAFFMPEWSACVLVSPLCAQLLRVFQENIRNN